MARVGLIARKYLWSPVAGITALALCLLSQGLNAAVVGYTTELVDFGAKTLPDFVVLNNTTMERISHGDGHARRVDFAVVDWPNVFFQAPEGGWDWSVFTGVAVSLYNPGEESVPVAMRVDNAGADGMNHCNTARGAVPPKGRFELRLRFNTGAGDAFWGMRGAPEIGPKGTGPVLDTAKITAFQVFLARPQQSCQLIFEKAWLFGSAEDAKVPMPFVDRFGQYRHDEWPGKLHDAPELITRAETEAQALMEAPALPGRDEYGHQKNAHSGADPIGGEGCTFSFYRSNLLRKYGDDWPEVWRNRAYRRLPAWGFNTIANWSQEDVLVNSPLPFVVSTGIWGVRPIEGGSGYWAKMKDVFAPEFPEQAAKSLSQAAGRYGKNPLCIGYFVDNELAWEGIRRGTLESPKDQPCRVALIAQLEAKYGNVAALNAAWSANAADWAALRTPKSLNPAADADLDEYLYRFARRYFQVIQNAVDTQAPNQLYLGCRFAGRPRKPVERACAEIVDVVSYNLYYSWLPKRQWIGKDDLGKPLIIGEFHFGALDRGMFHCGLVAAANQEERAAKYVRYLRSVAEHPAFIGCHWFQYVDEPVTGRWYDGENYNIGFVNVTDTPYPEMVRAAQQVHAEIYTRRQNAP